MQRRAPISLTKNACERIRSVAKGRMLRISLKAKGCSNMGYVLDFTDTPHDHDEVFTVEDINIAMSPQAVLLMLGTEVDFIQTQTKAHFSFNNPQEKGRCGCGESFKL